MLAVEIWPTNATWAIELLMNHTIFYGPVQSRFLEIWAKFLSRNSAALEECDEIVFGVLNHHLAEWLRSSRFVKRRDKGEGKLRLGLKSRIRINICIPIRSSMVLERKQVIVLLAFEWLNGGLPHHYVQMNVFLTPPMQLHNIFGHDPDLSTMSWWTTPPYVLTLQDRNTDFEVEVLYLWQHTRAAMSSLVNGATTDSMKSTWLKKISLIYSKEVPRYALCSTLHPDAWRFQIFMHFAQYNTIADRAAFTVNINLVVEAKELFIPFITFCSHVQADSSFSGIRECLARVSGNVCTSLGIYLVNKQLVTFVSLFSML